MKKLIFAALATFALNASASAQIADNCADVIRVMGDLQKDGLKSYRDKTIIDGKLYASNIKFSGFASSEIMVNDYLTKFSSKMTASDKFTALKNYENLVIQMKICLENKGYNTQDNSTDGNREITFMNSSADNLMASVYMQKEGNKYVVSMNVWKSKPSTMP